MFQTQPPTWMLEAMKKLNGSEARLIIAEKVMFASDVDQYQARLMLPKKRVLNREFLREEERTILEGSAETTEKPGVESIFVDPKFKTYQVSLKQWKKNMVICRWGKVLKGYKFEKGGKFSLWSFRSGEALYFALVPKGEEDYGYLEDFSDLDNLDYCFCSEDFSQLDMFQSSEYANVNALPDLGSFEDADVVASYYDDDA